MRSDLNKQVYIYSLDTSSFYNEEEYYIHNQLLKSYRIKKKLKERSKKIAGSLNSTECVIDEEGLITKRAFNKARSKKINTHIGILKNNLKELLEKFTGIRILKENAINDKKKIGMFNSALTRTIGMKVDEVSTSLFVVRIYYFRILEDLMENGFEFNGEKYIYFSSSAGQIRTKKAVFIKESLWKKHEGALTCGLSIDEINQKGGCNVNKLLAYKALTASASEKWYGFDIKKTIVVPDLETNVTSRFDYIDRNTYEITNQEMSVPIEHTDGCGMILPRKSKKSFMVRLPYVKGLLVPFKFNEFKNTKVIDVYGKEWDVIEDDIEVIFTKSQFKMKKYYDDWQDYQSRFIEHNCQAVKLNEEDIGENANLTYQMLQTLTDLTSKELNELSKSTKEDLKKIGSDKETMLRVMGATETNKKKNAYQDALLLYPELLNDAHSQKIIKDKKKSMVRDARSGKLSVNGKYTYLIPDLYAFCEWLFNGDKEPKGLLPNGEVFCRIFKEDKVNILRSPHLYKEHCVRVNQYNEERNKWFITDGIYTSIHDPISRVLQFDNDGDKALVVQNDLFTSVAERNMENIYPLFYEMEAAVPEQISNKKINDSLLLAFKANIGEISNNITKCFDSPDINLDVVKWLTMENNFEIDYAKTLFKPTRPQKVDTEIRRYIKNKVPHFFRYAKNKEKNRVEDITGSTVNKLNKIIPNNRIKFENIAGNFDYKNLMSEEVIHINNKIVNTYRKLDRAKKWIISSVDIQNKNEAMPYVYKYIKEELKKIEANEHRIVNVLVEELYHRTDAPVKTTLWNCFGDILLSNLRGNLKSSKQCEKCGERIKITHRNNKYCEECYKEYRKQQSREKSLRYYHNKK